MNLVHKEQLKKLIIWQKLINRETEKISRSQLNFNMYNDKQTNREYLQ